MTVLVWLPMFPQTMNRDQHSRGLGEGRLRSGTDVGPGKMRRRTASVVKPVSGSMWMTRVQLGRFERWWEEDTKGGALPFLFPAIGLHGFPMYGLDGGILRTGDGSPLLISAWWLVQFAQADQPPAWTSLSDDLWQVPVNLDILP